MLLTTVATVSWAVYEDIDQRYRDAHQDRVASLDTDIANVKTNFQNLLLRMDDFDFLEIFF